MSVNPTQSTQYTNSTYNNQSKAVTFGEDLGKDSFLQLLITQMRYQDPLEPASDTEFIAQLAQFNALEQMQNLNDKFDRMLRWSQMTQASSLIGKNIDGISLVGTDTNNDGQPDISNISGIVKEVKYVDGEPMLVLDSGEIRLSDVVRIY